VYGTFPGDLLEALVVVEYDRLIRETRLEAIVNANAQYSRLAKSVGAVKGMRA
jgi:hypothetical protein